MAVVPQYKNISILTLQSGYLLFRASSVQVLISIQNKLKKVYVLKRKTYLGTLNRRQTD
jgi:hypothetical protein